MTAIYPDKATSRIRRVVFGAIALVLLAGAVFGYRWWRDPERRLGPGATVSGLECGLGRPPDALLAIDGKSGALKWSRLVGGVGPEAQADGLAAANGTVAVVTTSEDILAVSATDGSRRWCGEGSVVSAVGDRLFTIQGKKTVELDAGSGAVRPIAADVLPTLLEAAADDIAVTKAPGYSDRHEITLTATDRRTGTDRWTKRVPGYEFVTTHDMVIVNDQSLLRSEVRSSDSGYGVATAYQLATGKRAWSTPLLWFGNFHLAGSRLILKGPGPDGITAIDVETGRVLWQTAHPNPGRTVRFSERGWITGVASDASTGDLFVLLRSEEPYRD